MAYDVEIAEYRPDHFAPLKELFGTYFGQEDRLLTTEYNGWLYEQNPFGTARIVTVKDGERWVAFMAMVPTELAQGNVRRHGYYVVNVLVHPDYQGKHLFGKMITAAKQFTAASETVLMGHPNFLALKAWERARMHFQDPLRPWMPLPWQRQCRLRTSSVTTRDELNLCRVLLEEAAEQSPGWRVAATPDYLDWRYLRHPTNSYQVQSVRAGDEYVALQVSKRVRFGAGMLVDQFALRRYTAPAVTKLPLFTICFWPDTASDEQHQYAIRLPWKKRLPIFFTDAVRASPVDVATLGLSASDF